RLARLGLHIHVALRRYISLIREVERRELRDTVVDRQSRRHREIWAPRSRGALILSETANVHAIEESRRGGGGTGGRSRRRRCGRRRWWLWRASSDGENRYQEQKRAFHLFLPLGPETRLTIPFDPCELRDQREIKP